MFNYNLDAITKVRIREKREASWWYWKPERKKFFGFIKLPAGFYYSLTLGSHEYYEKCPDNYYLEDGIVYENPNLTLYFNNESNKKFHFKDKKELQKFLNDVKSRSNCQWLEA